MQVIDVVVDTLLIELNGALTSWDAALLRETVGRCRHVSLSNHALPDLLERGSGSFAVLLLAPRRVTPSHHGHIMHSALTLLYVLIRDAETL